MSPIIYPSIRFVTMWHKTWTDEATAAIETWLVIGRRMGVVRDIRVVVARMIWASLDSWFGAWVKPKGAKRAKIYRREKLH